MCTIRERVYSTYPYLVYPEKNFRIKAYTTRPTLRVFVYSKTETFGDPMPLELAGLLINFTLYNKDNFPVLTGPALVSNSDNSEIEYTWQSNDLVTPGIYYGEFKFKDIDDSIFILPESPAYRIQILVF